MTDSPRHPIIQNRNVSKRFGRVTAVDDVSLDINAGEFFVLLGPSGCGKTTLLRMIAGFELPSDGQILIDGQDMTGIPPNKRPVNMVFRSEEHTSELQSLMRNSYDVFCLKKKKKEK